MARTLITSAIPDPSLIPTDGVLIITPHRAAAIRTGRPFVSLRSIAQRELRQRGIGVASPLFARRVLKRAINRVAPELDASAEADRLREILSTVLRIGIDVAKLEQHGSKRAKMLARVADLYTRKLQDHNLIDREALLRVASGFVVERQRVAVFGHFRARVEEIRYIDKLAADGSFYFLPVGDDPIFAANVEAVKTLQTNGWQQELGGVNNLTDIGERSAARFISSCAGKPKPAPATAESHTDVRSEIRTTLARVKRLLMDGESPERIAIVSRNVDAYAPFLASVADEYGLPLSFEHSVPIMRTALGEFLQLLIEALGLSENYETDTTPHLEFEPTARMLSHRLGPGLTVESWSAARRAHPSGVEAWIPFADTVVALTHKPAGPTFADKVAWLRSLLLATVVRDRAAHSAADLTAFDRLLTALDEQIASSDPEREISFDAFVAELFELLSTVSTPFAPSRVGVAVHQPNTIVGGEFDHIFVIGMAEGMLPASVTENPVIDFHERKKLEPLGIEFEEAADVPRWEALSFYFLVQAAQKSLTLSYPRYFDGAEQLPNSYFDRLGLDPSLGLNAMLSSSEEVRRATLLDAQANLLDPVLTETYRRFLVEQRRESPLPYDEFDGVIGPGIDHTNRRWSVSQLTKIGQCPFKWFAEKMLRLSAIEEAEFELDPRTRGSLYHTVLEIAVRSSLGAQDLRAAVLDNLDAAFAAAERSPESSVAHITTWELERNAHLEALRKAIMAEDFLPIGSRVLAVEQEFDTNWEALRISGRIDRIDESPEGLVTIDYKSGGYRSMVQDADGEAKIDLQLPIYTQAAIPSLYPDRSPVIGKYFNLAARKADIGKDVDLTEFIERVKGTLTTGRFIVRPDNEGKVCRFCDFEPVCRRGPRLARKQIDE